LSSYKNDDFIDKIVDDFTVFFKKLHSKIYPDNEKKPIYLRR